MFRQSTTWGLVLLLSGSALTLAACEEKGLESCTVVDIEGAEAEINLQDTDIERAEVEMVCGDQIIDVTWVEFKRKLNVDPASYEGNVAGFQETFGQCLLDTGSNKKEVQCEDANGDFQVLSFSFDD